MLCKICLNKEPENSVQELCRKCYLDAHAFLTASYIISKEKMIEQNIQDQTKVPMDIDVVRARAKNISRDVTFIDKFSADYNDGIRFGKQDVEKSPA